MEYSGIQYTLADLTPQELERLKKRSAQELRINSLVVLPSLAAIGLLIYYLNITFKERETLMEVINGIGGLAGALLAWYYARVIINSRKDFKSGKKKVAAGAVEGKRIVNEGKFNESYRMLFLKNEFEITPDIYKLVQKGIKIELHVTEKTERVLAIKRLG